MSLGCSIAETGGNSASLGQPRQFEYSGRSAATAAPQFEPNGVHTRPYGASRSVAVSHGLWEAGLGSRFADDPNGAAFRTFKRFKFKYRLN